MGKRSTRDRGEAPGWPYEEDNTLSKGPPEFLKSLRYLHYSHVRARGSNDKRDGGKANDKESGNQHDPALGFRKFSKDLHNISKSKRTMGGWAGELGKAHLWATTVAAAEDYANRRIS